jgi:integrase
MSVYRSGRGKWMIEVVWRTPGKPERRVRRVSPSQTKAGATTYELQVRAALLAGTFEAEATVAPLLDAFVVEYLRAAATNNKPSTVDSKRAIFERHLLPVLGRQRLDAIGVREIESLKADLAQRLSPKTINNCLTVLRHALATAVQWKLIATVPAVQWLRVPEQDFRFLDFDEAQRLVAAAQGADRTMVVVALNTGMRLGEMLALRWSDIDLKAGRLVVRRAVARGIVGTPKSGRSREIPLNDTVTRALEQHRHLRGPLVFCTDDGRMLTKNEAKAPLARARRRSGIVELGWHDLRHTFASHLVMRGVPLKAVQELLGHATIEMTMRYAHLAPATKSDAVRVLDGATGGAMVARLRG